MRRAFTLIEMLVVIAIIAILAGMLMPALNRARREAQKAKCTNNEKNVGALFIMYRSDFRHMPKWPQDLWSLSPALAGFKFPDNLPATAECFDSSLALALMWQTYADSEQLFTCPGTDHEVQVGLFDANGVQMNFDNDLATTEYRFATNLSQSSDSDYLVDPWVPENSRSNRVIYGDGPDLAYMRARWSAWSGQPQVNFRAGEYTNHPKGAELLFFDGHTDYSLIKDNGALTNSQLPDPAVDADVYANDNADGDGNYYNDTKEDCNLGNFQMVDPGSGVPNLVDYWAGPDGTEANNPNRNVDVNAAYKDPWLP